MLKTVIFRRYKYRHLLSGLIQCLLHLWFAIGLIMKVQVKIKQGKFHLSEHLHTGLKIFSCLHFSKDFIRQHFARLIMPDTAQ